MKKRGKKIERLKKLIRNLRKRKDKKVINEFSKSLWKFMKEYKIKMIVHHPIGLGVVSEDLFDKMKSKTYMNKINEKEKILKMMKKIIKNANLKKENLKKKPLPYLG